MAQQWPVLTDGAWGTELQARGLPAGEVPDLWNLTHAEKVEQVASAYVAAGSQIILTNTFRSNRIALAHLSGRIDIRALNRAGVEISKRAAGTSARVYASVGPSGKLLASGDVSERDLEAAFEEQIEALVEAGADGIVIETMADLDEARIALRIAKRSRLPVVVSMVFDSGKNRDRTLTGVTPEQAARELTSAGADVVGANCGHGIEGYIPVCSRMRSATTSPLWMKPNAGLPELVDGVATYKISPQEFAARVPALVQAGANYVGGCCGTNPEFIRAIKTVLADP